MIGAVLIVVLLLREPADIHSENIIFKGLKALMDKSGKFSYGLYLWHSLVIMLILNTSMIFNAPPYETTATFLSVFFLIVVISFCVSYIFHSIIEKPYQKLYKIG